MNDYRYELKFVLDESKLSQCMAWLYGGTSARVAHPSRTVNTVYFDDPGYSSVRDNLAGISERSKTRLRWYHEEDKEKVNGACLEVKRRSGRLGSKDRFDVPGIESDILNLKYSDLFPRLHAHIGDSDAFLVDSHMFPTLHISYWREYFEGLNGIRVTFDRSIRFYQPLSHLRPFESTAISYPNTIMEVKFTTQQKDAVAQSLRKLNLTPRRHSKYLVGLAAFGYATYY